MKTGKKRVLPHDVIEAWHLATGHLVYVRRDGVAMVAPFDLDDLEISGPAVPAFEDVHVNTVYGFAPLTVSASGSLVYARGSGVASENTIVRVSRAGDAPPYDTAWHGRSEE